VSVEPGVVLKSLATLVLVKLGVPTGYVRSNSTAPWEHHVVDVLSVHQKRRLWNQLQTQLLFQNLKVLVRSGAAMESNLGVSVVQPSLAQLVMNVPVMSQSQPAYQRWQEDVKLGVEMVSKHGRSVVQPTHVLVVANVQVKSQSQPPNQQQQDHVWHGVATVSNLGVKDVLPSLAQLVLNVQEMSQSQQVYQR